MSELTADYLDKKLSEQTKELKSYVEEQVEKLSKMVERNVVESINEKFRETNNRFDEINQGLNKLGGAINAKH